MHDQKTNRCFAHYKEVSSNPGHLFIISAPSGGGKTTLCRAVLERFPEMLFSVSYTTRKPRKGEKHGVEYYFISQDDFEKGIEKGEWAEWAEVHGYFYGTSAEFLDRNLASGKDILLDIDVQGTVQLLKRYPDSITIFILPPSFDTLKKRLESRGSDSQEAIARRLAIAEKEMAQKDLYRHVIVNDQLSASVDELISIINRYRPKELSPNTKV